MKRRDAFLTVLVRTRPYIFAKSKEKHWLESLENLNIVAHNCGWMDGTMQEHNQAKIIIPFLCKDESIPWSTLGRILDG